MDKKPYMKLLRTLDSLFFSDDAWMNDDAPDRVEYEFSRTHFDKDYIDFDDFISYHIEGLEYIQFQQFTDQYGEVEFELRSEVIEVLFNLVYFSELDDEFKRKLSSYLARYDVLFSDDLYYKSIASSTDTDYSEGSFGRVFFLDDNFVKKQLKSEYWLDNDISSRFKNEFNIQLRLSRSEMNVLKVHDYDATMNSFLMERADMDLYSLLEDNRLDEDKKNKLINQMLLTMSMAHEKGINHRDLHPGNIMIKGDKVYVSDFGFAKDSNHLRSRLSTVSPKPTHQFVAPEGFNDFTELDELSDIYSLGKIIDYIMGDGNLGGAHSFRPLVDKCTYDEKSRRFQSVIELKKSFSSIYEVYLKGEDIKQITSEIQDGNHSIIGEEYLIKLAKENRVASQIVANNWVKVSRVILECSSDNQNTIMKSIDCDFIEATGYKGWENYDIFATIAYDVLIESADITICKYAYSILNGCAKNRFGAKHLLDSVPFDKVQLLN